MFFRVRTMMLLITAILLAAVLVPGLGLAADPSDNAPAEVKALQASGRLKEALGGFLYFDPNLSTPVGQACASCHLPSAGFADPDHNLPVSEGAVKGRFGTRSAPTSAYASFSPTPYYNDIAGTWVGGQYWDGRAPTLVEQAKGPFLNPGEMNMSSKAAVVDRVKKAHYALLFRLVYGPKVFDNTDAAFNNIADAIAAFEKTSLLNSFTSKYDAYLNGKAKLTTKEARGLALFNDSKKGNCAACHPSAGPKPLFTDFTYDNLGVPKNMNIPAYKASPSLVDYGLGAIKGPQENGKFKVPTLRNLARTAPYAHNGYFKTIKQIVNFYSTAGIPGMWPAPEVPENVNRNELGNLGLTEAEKDAIAEFLGTLTDGYWDR